MLELRLCRLRACSNLAKSARNLFPFLNDFNIINSWLFLMNFFKAQLLSLSMTERLIIEGILLIFMEIKIFS